MLWESSISRLLNTFTDIHCTYWKSIIKEKNLDTIFPKIWEMLVRSVVLCTRSRVIVPPVDLVDYRKFVPIFLSSMWTRFIRVKTCPIRFSNLVFAALASICKRCMSHFRWHAQMILFRMSIMKIGEKNFVNDHICSFLFPFTSYYFSFLFLIF